jgi:hypothetical protein
LPASDYGFLDSNRPHIARYRAVFDGIVGGGLLLGGSLDGPVRPWPPSLIVALRRAPLLVLGLSVLFTAGVAIAVRPARDPATRLTRLALALACWNVFWVAAVGCLFEVGENNRFRVAVHPDWIMLAALVLQRVTDRIRGFAR